MLFHKMITNNAGLFESWGGEKKNHQHLGEGGREEERERKKTTSSASATLGSNVVTAW